jgi:hypothetical protein
VRGSKIAHSAPSTAVNSSDGRSSHLGAALIGSAVATVVGYHGRSESFLNVAR